MNNIDTKQTGKHIRMEANRYENPLMRLKLVVIVKIQDIPIPVYF